MQLYWANTSIEYNGELAKEDFAKEDLIALEKGISNSKAFRKHQKFGVPAMVVINRFHLILIRK